MVDLDKLGPLLKSKRREKNITQEDIAQKLGLTKNHVSEIERGKHRITVQTLITYCDSLNITPNDLLEINETRNIIPELEKYLSELDEDRQQKLLSIAKVL